MRTPATRRGTLPFGLAAVAGLLCVPALASSQQQAPPQFRATVGRVLVDVSVVDDDGRFVPGLTIDDFRLYEDGREVEISFFAVERFREEVPWAKEIPVAAEISETPVLPRYLVLFVDGFNTPPNEWYRVRTAVSEYLREGLQPNDRVLLATLAPDRRLLVAPEFTRDTDNLVKVIDQIRTNPEIAERDRSNEQRIFQVLYEDVQAGSITNNLEETQGPVEVEATRLRHGASLAQAFAGERKNEVLYTLDAMVSLARHLNQSFDVPGPKVMVMVSSGIPQNPGSNYFYMINSRVDQIGVEVRQTAAGTAEHPVAFRHQSAETIEMYLMRTIGNLNRLNYTLYTIGARGSGPALNQDLTEQLRSGISGSIRQISHRDQQEGLRMLANGTGGLAFDNSYNYMAAFDRIDRDTALRYVLGYAPPPHDPGADADKFYRIDVEVDVPGVRVRARKGYVE